MKLIDHTEPLWNKRYTALKRENGAKTYSEEIVEHQIPLWKKYLPKDSVVSTCTLLQPEHFKKTNIAVQYLHEVGWDNPTKDTDIVLARIGKKAKRVIFVTAYRWVEKELTDRGLEAIFIPMTIQADKLPKQNITKRGRIVYFGNIMRFKSEGYLQLKTAIRKSNLVFDTVSNNTLNGKKLTNQQEVWQELAQYEYGIGVGRCALEMLGIGLKVIIGGIRKDEMGLILNDQDFKKHEAYNFNGKHTMGIKNTLVNLSRSIPLTNDIKNKLPEIEETIKGSI